MVPFPFLMMRGPLSKLETETKEGLRRSNRRSPGSAVLDSRNVTGKKRVTGLRTHCDTRGPRWDCF